MSELLNELRHKAEQAMLALNKINSECYAKKSVLEAEMSKKKSVLEAEMSKTLNELFGQRLKDAEAAQRDAEKALRDEQDRITLEKATSPWPVGTLMAEWMAEWKHRDRYVSKPGERVCLTGAKGKVEIVTRETEHPENIAYYARASIGQSIIRLLRKNGEPGKTYVIIPRVLSKNFLWLPVGQNLNSVLFAEEVAAEEEKKRKAAQDVEKFSKDAAEVFGL